MSAWALAAILTLTGAAPVGAAGAASPMAALLQCDGPVYATEALDAAEDGGSTPEKALAAIYRKSGRPVPLHGYDLLRRTSDVVVFAYRHDGGIRAAVRVEKGFKPPLSEGRSTLAAWTWTAYATCDPAEFAPSADDEIGIRLVRRADGTRLPARLIHLHPANPHCEPDAWILLLDGLVPTYVRDPQGALRTAEPYEADTTLPPTAVDTGLRTGEFALFAHSAEAIYAVGPDHVERWPASVPNAAVRGCG